MSTIEKLARVALWAAALTTIAVLVVILTHILKQGLGVINLPFLLDAPRRMGREGGIFPTIVSTLYLTAVAIAMVAPVGIGAAVYLVEYTRENWLTRLIRFGTETLAGIPSIIFGLFGFAFLVIYLGLGWSVLSGGLTLAFMILPTVVRTSEEALKTVPRSYREGSLALGATRWQTIQKVVLPAALPGIITGIILGIGRAVGETAALLLTAGSSLRAPVLLSDPARSMSVHLFVLTTEGLSMERAYGTATVLILAILIINSLANWLRRRLTIKES
ncbi:MAG: phosphate ABC transporter permease PstA [Syntrophothermus sp.]